MNTETIRDNILEAIQKFIEKDKDLLMRLNVHEIAISHRIAVYLECLFGRYNVDCEYNKHYYGAPKRSGGKRIRPDIIIHDRKSPLGIAIFEIKKCGPDSKLGKRDIKKLKKAQSNLGYRIGVYIGALKKNIHIVWIAGGQEIHRERL